MKACSRKRRRFLHTSALSSRAVVESLVAGRFPPHPGAVLWVSARQAYTKMSECCGHVHCSREDSRTHDPWQPGTEAAVQNVLKHNGKHSRH